MGRRMLGLWGLGLFLASVTTATESQTETKEEVKWSAYEHVGEADFKKALEERPYNLVACKCLIHQSEHDKQTNSQQVVEPKK